MSKTETAKRYLTLFVGLLFVSFGIAFVTKASLGTSPISAIPYTLSLVIPELTMGNWTIIFSILLILAQIALLKKEMKIVQLIIQLVITFFFGYFIDFSLWILQAFEPEIYIVKLCSLLIGCAILAFGAYLQIIADVAMIPGDAFVRALVKVSKKEYGIIRIISDVSMASIAAIICLICLKELIGVREGTVIAALLIGNIVRIYSRKLVKLQDLLFPAVEEEAYMEEAEAGTGQPLVITIAREYGSGGRAIGKRIAASLGIGYYDSSIIQMTAKESGYEENIVRDNEQKISHSLLHSLYAQYTAALTEADLPKIEKLFKAEERIIKGIAAKESCVIVGRLSNHILKDHKNAVHVFISADMDAKIERVVHRENLTAEQAKEKILKVEKERSNYCKYFSHSEWRNSDNYDIVMKSNKYGVRKTAHMLIELLNSI